MAHQLADHPVRHDMKDERETGREWVPTYRSTKIVYSAGFTKNKWLVPQSAQSRKNFCLTFRIRSWCPTRPHFMIIRVLPPQTPHLK